MSASPNDFVPEAGNRPTRIEFVREDSRGVTPESPDWNTFSDHINSWWDWEPDASKEAVQPHGDSDPDFTKPGSETHEATFAYWLQNWFVDSNGDPLDASADAMLLSEDNDYKNTHSVVSRMDISSGGADDAGYRVYHVGKGGAPQEVTIPFEVDDGTPVTPELSYMFEKVRTYRIDQPSSSGLLTVENNGTSEVEVSIEDEGASTSDSVTVAGGSTSETIEEFDNIDAVELSNDVDGTVQITDGNGTVYMTIHGSDEYTVGGDLGVPTLGSGSHASAIDSDYIVFNDDEYGFDTEEMAGEIISGELTVAHEAGDDSVTGTSRRNINTGGRRATWTATVAGASESVRQATRYLTAESFDLKWTADEGTITGPSAEHFSPGSSSFESGSGKHQRDLEFQSKGIEISN